MRVALITPWAGSAYGTEMSLGSSKSLLQNAGHTCEIFTGEWNHPEAPPADVHVLPTIGLPSPVPNPFPFSAGANQLHAALIAFAPDVVHFHETLNAPISLRIGRAFPSIFTAHSVGMTCPASHRTTLAGPVCELKSGWSCLAHNRKLHCLDYFRKPHTRALVVAHHLLKERAVKKYFHVLAVSHYLKRVFLQCGWPQEKVHVVYNPVNLASLPHTPDTDPPLLLVAARLRPPKGLAIVLQGLARIAARKWTCVIAGSGDELAPLKALATELGIADRIQFLGHVPHPELQKLYSRATMVLQTNVGPEGFGLSVAEASAAGLPVVVSDVPALNEIVRAEETGLVVPIRSPESVARAIDRLLGNPALARQLGEAGRKRVAADFSPATHLQGLLAAYAAVRAR